jgi:DNA-directed RNA polymerase specialized sigma24 family protein
VELTFITGDVYDVRPCNIVEQKEPIPQEWTDRMCEQSTDYERNYKRICNAVSFFNGLSIEDSQDVVSQTFLYLCTEGFNESIKDHNDFIGLWMNLSQKRAIDFWRRRFILSDNLEKIIGCRQRTYEVNLFEVQPGARSQKYLKLWAQGYSPTEIAKECGVNISTVSSSISRSIQFLQKYLSADIAKA